MRIAAFSDIHGNLSGLRAVLERIAAMGGADVIYSAGDMLGYGPGAEDVLDLLVESEVRLLRGNHEAMYLDDAVLQRFVHPSAQAYFRAIAAWLRSRLTPAHWDLLAGLPLAERLEPYPDRSVFLCHSTPASPWSFACSADSPPEALELAYGAVADRVIVFGHAHRGRYNDQYVRAWKDKLLVNVASVGARRDGFSAFTLLDVRRDQVLVTQHQVPYDAAAEATRMVERDVPEH